MAKLLAEWFWTDRWMGSSGFLLPMEARGIYREMLTQAWRRGARLPNDHEAIRRAIGATPQEWRRSWPKVERFWRVDGDSLVNDTQMEVYAEAEGMSQRATTRASTAASKRWKQSTSNAQASPEHNPSTAQAEHKQCPPISDLRSPSPKRVLAENARTARVRVGTNPTDFSDDTLSRVGDFVDRYRELYTQHRNGAHYLGNPQSDFREASLLCETWDDARLEKLATVFLTTDHAFAEKGSRTLAQFRSMASWCDGKLRERGL